jgi:hypothetical protein
MFFFPNLTKGVMSNNISNKLNPQVALAANAVDQPFFHRNVP